MQIRDATAADFGRILELNLESEHFLSPLSVPHLTHLYAEASVRRVIAEHGLVQGFLLAFREGADYDNENYQWFVARYAQFLYVDRVVIASAARGRQCGYRLYEDLCVTARASGVGIITCEYDTDPPNEASRRFHERFGFREVGCQRVAGGTKAVSLQKLAL